jgi:CubicO group peptidase (beta-lactamase class C family)
MAVAWVPLPVAVALLAAGPISARAWKGTERAVTDLASVLRPIREAHKLPALAGAIVTTDGLTAIGAVGVRKAGTDTPVTVGDQFHLGSCTKAMTATLLAILVQRGKLTWDMPLREALPALADTMHPAYRAVTVEQLLAHRSGMPAESWPSGKTFQDMHKLPGSPMQQRMAYVKSVLQEPSVAAPGSKFIYSNRSYAVAGAIAERISGAAWEGLMRREVFGPLAMTTAGYGAMGKPGRVDQPWQHVMSGGAAQPIAPGPLADNPAVIAPAGTVHCSLGDWARFVADHLRAERGEGKLLNAETARRLHAQVADWEYAFGWAAVDRDWGGGRVLTHAGSNNQNYCVAWVAPRRGFAVLAAANVGGPEAAAACDEAASAMIRSHLAGPPGK